MMDVITGKTRPTPARPSSARPSTSCELRENEIASIGIGRKFQKPTVFEQLTVFENLELALKADRGVRTVAMFFRLSGEQLDRIGSTRWLNADPPEGQRPTMDRRPALHGQKQWLEIGMLLMQDPKLLLLDEPVAGMTDEETERTAELFLSLEGNHSLVVVEHDMKFIVANSRRASRARRSRCCTKAACSPKGSLAEVTGKRQASSKSIWAAEATPCYLDGRPGINQYLRRFAHPAQPRLRRVFKCSAR